MEGYCHPITDAYFPVRGSLDSKDELHFNESFALKGRIFFFALDQATFSLLFFIY